MCMTIQTTVCSCASRVSPSGQRGCDRRCRRASVAGMASLDFPDVPRAHPRRVAPLPRRAGRLRPRGAGAGVSGLGRRRPALAPRRGAVVLGRDRRARARPRPDEDARARAARRRTTSCWRRFDERLRRGWSRRSRRADPAEPAWTWSAEQTVGFTLRRQAHEALIHRLDAEQTAGDGHRARRGAGRRRGARGAST